MAVEAMLLSVVKWLLAVEVVLLLTAMWPLKVLVAEVGFLVFGRAMSGGVTRRPTSCLLPEVLEEFQTTSTQP